MKKYFKRLYTKGCLEYYEKLNKYLDTNTKKFIMTANPEMFKLAKENQNLENEILNAENDVIADGIAIVKCAKHYNVDVKERITGFDTAVKLLELANEKKKTLYLFGAKDEVITKLVEIIKEKYPNIKLLGYSNGYEKDKDKIFRKIIKLKPDICLVALGIPMQEELIAKYIKQVDKGIYVGVGGSFDVLSGTKQRAPKLFIKLNLEWLYRIVKEPSRFKRFYNNNIKFVLMIMKDKK